jgi:prepilin-type N-terminal cleavage/methylation domain-containing protein
MARNNLPLGGGISGGTARTVNEYLEDRKEQGFTLIELLIAIVVVGILTAVAIVGIAGLTKNGASSACATTQDAIKAAESVYYANNQGKYPADFYGILGAPDGGTANPAMLELTGGAKAKSATEIDGNGGWTVTISSGGGTSPFTLGTTGC